MEIFRDIKNYEGCYQVSNLGRVKSLKRKWVINERILRPDITLKGYLIVNLCKKGKCKTYRVNRLVALTFIKNPNNYPEVDHKNRIKCNNEIDNLRWVNGSMNQRNSDRCENATSKYNGVYWKKKDRKWNTVCRVKDKIIHIGSFADEIEASKAFDDFCIENNLDRELNRGILCH